jgi:carbonic anhydrase/acetyltransferase-like protein (isoleucine patch superfamily)
MIGEESLIAAGSVVTPGTVIPPGSMVMGAPAKVKRELTPEERAQGRALARKYFELAQAHSGGTYRRASASHNNIEGDI